MPGKRAEFREAREVALVCRDDGHSGASCAHGKKRIVGEPRFADAFITIFLSEPRENSAGLGPVAKIRDEDAPRRGEVMFELFDDGMVPAQCAW